MAKRAGSPKPRPGRPGGGRGRADVAVLVVLPDAAAEQTLSEAMRREGWQMAAAGHDAACAVVMWSEHSVDSDEIAAAARPYLDRGKLLQVLWQPPQWDNRQLNYIEAPDPFCFYNSLVVGHRYLDGSEWAIDGFASRLSDGEKILAELARLGDLPRPRDSWNAKIEFWAPMFGDRPRPAIVVELAGDRGRVLRRVREDGRLPTPSRYQTTIGNRWQIVDERTGQLLEEIVVSEPETSADLPWREPWWRRRRDV